MVLLFLFGCDRDRAYSTELLAELQNNNKVTMHFGTILKLTKRKYDGFWSKVEDNEKSSYLYDVTGKSKKGKISIVWEINDGVFRVTEIRIFDEETKSVGENVK